MTDSIVAASSTLMSPEDLAAMIQVRVSTLATWRHKNLGPTYVKLGKKVFYRRDDVTRWVGEQAVHPAAFPTQEQLKHADERQTELAV